MTRKIGPYLLFSDRRRETLEKAIAGQGDDFLTIKESLLLYTTLDMTVAFNLSDGLHRMHISGTIRWNKRMKKGDKSFVSMGITFHRLDEKSKEILEHYVSLGTGDTNLICNL
jgi:hypothetical protein